MHLTFVERESASPDTFIVLSFHFVLSGLICGENQALDQMRLQIIEEVEKAEKNLLVIEKVMQKTFALRHQDSELPVRDILNSWPALQIESQVCSKFHCITNVNPRNTFYSELDRYTPRLMTLYRQKASRTGKTAEALRAILEVYDLQEEEEPDFNDVSVALLTSGPDPFSCEKVFVIVEGNIVLRDLPRISEAFMLLFDLT